MGIINGGVMVEKLNMKVFRKSIERMVFDMGIEKCWELKGMNNAVRWFLEGDFLESDI